MYIDNCERNRPFGCAATNCRPAAFTMDIKSSNESNFEMDTMRRIRTVVSIAACCAPAN